MDKGIKVFWKGNDSGFYTYEKMLNPLIKGDVHVATLWKYHLPLLDGIITYTVESVNATQWPLQWAIWQKPVSFD